MSASTSSAPNAGPASTTKSNQKSNKPSKRVILHLSPTLLAKFPSAQPPRKASRSKPIAPPTPATPLSEEAEQTPPELKPEPELLGAGELVSVATSQDPLASAADRKILPGSKSGASLKRPATALDENGQPKARGKPGPKKRTRTDGDSNTPIGGAPLPTHHKLGPKFHQGAINAGLRALDRTGRPCRKWRPKGFQLKSFTGVAWELPSWRTPKSKEPGFNGDVKSETTGSSDAKLERTSSGTHSEKSSSMAVAKTSAVPADIASSPVPVLLPETVLAA